MYNAFVFATNLVPNLEIFHLAGTVVPTFIIQMLPKLQQLKKLKFFTLHTKKIELISQLPEYVVFVCV
jgi:hypothetical protein